jgi:hypothetical protein
MAAATSTPTAHALSGFTGSFSAPNWSRQATYNNTTNEITIACDSLEWAFDYQLIYACFNFDNLEDGIASLGATPFADQTDTTATLTWQNSSHFAYFVSFKVDLIWSEGLGGSATATVSTYDSPTSTAPTLLASLNQNSDTATVAETAMARINPNGRLEFRVTAPIDQAGYVTLQISEFNGVPAPLPATGAASVFAYSRRLRRRCRSEARTARCPSPRQRPPSAYLSRALLLPGDALNQIPVSFDYAAAVSPPRQADRAGRPPADPAIRAMAASPARGIV